MAPSALSTSKTFRSNHQAPSGASTIHGTSSGKSSAFRTRARLPGVTSKSSSIANAAPSTPLSSVASNTSKRMIPGVPSTTNPINRAWTEERIDIPSHLLCTGQENVSSTARHNLEEGLGFNTSKENDSLTARHNLEEVLGLNTGQENVSSTARHNLEEVLGLNTGTENVSSTARHNLEEGLGLKRRSADERKTKAKVAAEVEAAADTRHFPSQCQGSHGTSLRKVKTAADAIGSHPSQLFSSHGIPNAPSSKSSSSRASPSKDSHQYDPNIMLASSSREGRQFTVGSVGNNGNIYLRPLDKNVKVTSPSTPASDFTCLSSLQSGLHAEETSLPARPTDIFDMTTQGHVQAHAHKRWSDTQASRSSHLYRSMRVRSSDILSQRSSSPSQTSSSSNRQLQRHPQRLRARSDSLSTLEQNRYSDGRPRITSTDSDVPSQFISRSDTKTQGPSGMSDSHSDRFHGINLNVFIPDSKLGCLYPDSSSTVCQSLNMSMTAAGTNGMTKSLLQARQRQVLDSDCKRPTHSSSSGDKTSVHQEKNTAAPVNTIPSASTKGPVPTRMPNMTTLPTKYHTREPILPSIYDAIATDEDDRSIVRYVMGTREISAASPARLVTQVTSGHFLDYELINDFFLTVRAYLSTADLLAYLLARFEWAFERIEADGHIIRVRVFTALRHWVLNYFPYDFVVDRDLRVTFCDHLNALARRVRLGTYDAGDCKLLLDLKKIWNGRCELYWDIHGHDGDEIYYAPGGIVGSRDSELTHPNELWTKLASTSTNKINHAESDAALRRWVDSVIDADVDGQSVSERHASLVSAHQTVSIMSDQSVQATSCTMPTKTLKGTISSGSATARLDNGTGNGRNITPPRPVPTNVVAAEDSRRQAGLASATIQHTGRAALPGGMSVGTSAGNTNETTPTSPDRKMRRHLNLPISSHPHGTSPGKARVQPSSPTHPKHHPLGFSDSLRDKRTSLMAIHEGKASSPECTPMSVSFGGGLIRGNVFGPVSPFIEHAAVTSPTSPNATMAVPATPRMNGSSPTGASQAPPNHTKQGLYRTMSPDKLAARSVHPGVRNLLGTIRRAWGGKQTNGNQPPTTMLSAATVTGAPPVFMVEENQSVVLPMHVAHKIEGLGDQHHRLQALKSNARIDLLCADVSEMFQKAVLQERNSHSLQRVSSTGLMSETQERPNSDSAGIALGLAQDEQRLLSTTIRPRTSASILPVHGELSRNHSNTTTGSRSVMIIDDTHSRPPIPNLPTPYAQAITPGSEELAQTPYSVGTEDSTSYPLPTGYIPLAAAVAASAKDHPWLQQSDSPFKDQNQNTNHESSDAQTTSQNIRATIQSELLPDLSFPSPVKPNSPKRAYLAGDKGDSLKPISLSSIKPSFRASAQPRPSHPSVSSSMLRRNMSYHGSSPSIYARTNGSTCNSRGQVYPSFTSTRYDGKSDPANHQNSQRSTSPSAPLRTLRRRPGGNLRSKSTVNQLARARSTGSINTFAETLRESIQSSQQRQQCDADFARPSTSGENVGPCGSRFANPTSTDLAHKVPHRSISLMMDREESQSESDERPSFERAVARFAQIPDDEGGDLEATLLKLEGKFRKSPSEAAPQPSTFGMHGPRTPALSTTMMSAPKTQDPLSRTALAPPLPLSPPPDIGVLTPPLDESANATPRPNHHHQPNQGLPLPDTAPPTATSEHFDTAYRGDLTVDQQVVTEDAQQSASPAKTPTTMPDLGVNSMYTESDSSAISSDVTDIADPLSLHAGNQQQISTLSHTSKSYAQDNSQARVSLLEQSYGNASATTMDVPLTLDGPDHDSMADVRRGRCRSSIPTMTTDSFLLDEDEFLSDSCLDDILDDDDDDLHTDELDGLATDPRHDLAQARNDTGRPQLPPNVGYATGYLPSPPLGEEPSASATKPKGKSTTPVPLSAAALRLQEPRKSPSTTGANAAVADGAGPATMARSTDTSKGRSPSQVDECVLQPFANKVHQFPPRRHIPFILAYEASVLAEQFTLIERDALNEINWQDLIDLRWQQNPPLALNWVEHVRFQQDCNGIDLVAARFNLVVRWAISEVVLTHGVEERVMTITQLIRIAQHARQHYNFATFLQLTLALTSLDSTRLTNTWAKVPDSVRREMREMETLMSPLRNFHNLRNEMEAVDVNQGLIPVLAIYLHDLTYNAQKPAVIASTRGAEPLINFERYRAQSKLVRLLLRLADASAKYHFKPVEGVLERCLWLASLSEEGIRNKSREIQA